MVKIEASLALVAPILSQGPAAAVQHPAGVGLAGGHLPQLLEPDGVVLGLDGALQVEAGDQLLAEVAAGPLGKQGVATI